MAGGILRGPRHCNSQLEWHIEPGRAWCFAIQLYARQIVNGITATLNKLENPFQSPRTGRDAQRGPGHEPQDGQSYDVCEVESFKLGVVRDVEKYGVLVNALSWHCCAVPSGSLQTWTS